MRLGAGIGLVALLAALPGVARAFDCEETYADYEIVAGMVRVYADAGYDVPGGSIHIETMDDGTRVLVVEATAGRNDIEEILYLGFLGGGLAAACGKKPIDAVAIVVQVTFKDNEIYTFVADGKDCIKLIEEEVSWEYFLDNMVTVI